MEQPLKMNKMLYRYIYIFSVALLLFSCKNSTQPILSIPLLEKEIKVDGVIDKKEWQQAIVIENLLSPWDTDYQDKTTFRVFASNVYFNFFFHVEDSTFITVPYEKELSVAEGDRVELFFSKDTTLTKYYCIEIDMRGKILDYSAKYYREFNEDWNFESKKVAAKITGTGYIVEGKISFEELKELGIANPFYLGVFRADYKSHKSDDITWFSWIKPSSSQPDFHIPSAFGKILIK